MLTGFGGPGLMVTVGNLIYLVPEVPAFIIVELAYWPWVRPRQMVWLCQRWSTCCWMAW